MDIKDFILIGGGLLIAAVIAHGFWIAWLERRRDLRFDIQPDLIPDLIDDMARLKGELPNGGARVSRSRREEPEQNALPLEDPPPLLLEPSEGPPPAPVRSDRTPPVGPEQRRESRSGTRADTRAEPRLQIPGQAQEPLPERGFATVPGAGARSKVADVSLPEPLVTEPSRNSRRLSQRRTPERAGSASFSGAAVTDRATASRPASSRSLERAEPAASAPVEELLVLNVLADRRAPYTGDGLFTVLRSEGLKWGDMNIFHRVEPLTKVVHYSIANAVEPGTFDMSEMESFRSPGLCLFLQLPGPENPLEAFEDMLKVARTICRTLGGEIKDEQRNVMTPQTVEHYRQRVLEFSRRRMSKRA
ncbi:MAG: cell division protein ZipA [Pseudomonadales bacterium]|nr:cell division protein ZipA [Pseudomonadales bacterium]